MTKQMEAVKNVLMGEVWAISVVEKRAFAEGWYVFKNHATIRQTADEFDVPKSTVYRDLREILPQVSPVLAQAVDSVLKQNKKEAHIRGGEATRRKWRRKRVENLLDEEEKARIKYM